MGVTWAGKNESSRSASSRSAREQVGSAFRRVLSTTDRRVAPKAAPVEFSELRDALAAVAALHKVAAEERGGRLSAPSPAALNKSFGAAGDAASWPEPPRGPDARNEGRRSHVAEC